MLHLVVGFAMAADATFGMVQVPVIRPSPPEAIPGCPDLVAAPREMNIGTQYVTGDPSASRIDQRAAIREVAARKPISRAVSTIIRLADRYLTASAVNREMVAQCLQQHLLAQARGEAMMGAVSQYDNFYREWMVGALAIAYFKAQTDLQKQPGADEVRSWFLVSARQIRDANNRRLARGQLDNHSYWGGLAAMTVGKAFRDSQLVGFGRRIRAQGLASVNKDGSLSAEMRRKQLSFHYHVFAAAPLAVSIALDPEGTSTLEIKAMKNLASYIAENINRSADGPIARHLGIRQEPEMRPVIINVLKPFVCEQKSKKALYDISKNDGPYYQFLGGNVFWLSRRIGDPC